MQAQRTLRSMDEIIESIKKDPKQMYTLMDIAERGLMPWALNYRTVRKILDADACGPNLLKVQISGSEKMRSYLVPKRALLKYLQIHGPSLMTLVRKPKHHGKKTTSTKAHSR